MRRIALGGEGLSEFPDDCAGGYFKFLFENGSQMKPAMRTYTIRSFDRVKSTIEVDFVLHGDEGVASAWASSAIVGDSITIAGPGPKKTVNMDADWFFLIGDLSALPALSINLLELRQDAKGYALIFVDDLADRQYLIAPEGIQVEWLVMNEPISSGHENSLDIVKQKPWMPGLAAVWLAGEFEEVKRLKKFFRKDKNIPKDYSYYSSYWKRGLTEPDHKILKQDTA
jgi:NADPH-dependent ferric siderophore reductase